ncbi:YccF domain-containing protein [Limnohabitans sp. Rim8]|uniref:YccF domain-containing protein n=1 Tax=Limnohabitans sp. Rim8 TaxID=1100718 RepID=UPI00345B0D20
MRQLPNRKKTAIKFKLISGSLGLLDYIVWSLFADVWLAHGQVMSAVACFFTFIGIPFGIQHL